ncbi:hypothetical protein B0H13DRAFT_2376072 [Mycena leptocephala]|nr:hypothetical protein B0H13DRAFT_2376072 [Mycena leptocephala]
MANLSSSSDATAIDINTPNMMATVDFDAMFAEMETPNNTPPHSLFADVNANAAMIIFSVCGDLPLAGSLRLETMEKQAKQYLH